MKTKFINFSVAPQFTFLSGTSRALAAVFAVALALTSCNKDDVILPDEPSGGENGTDRPVAPGSSAWCNAVLEWTPAPGQFINDPTGGYKWPESMTPEEAAEIALERLTKGYTVSLGGFGGYIVVGFDHSVANTGGYDIGVMGNAFNSQAGDSNEPGIVYVMQDSNGNGLPDDTWYELKGSDTFDSSTIRDYAVTYYRPDGEGQNIRWTDNQGNEGDIVYNNFHSQPSYYPVWIKTPSYTLKGTRLANRSERNPTTGNWSNKPFEWGYADNMGSDVIDLDGVPDCNRFRISDAIDAEGKTVELKYIDFVKIQTGVNFSSGWLGEISTEVLGVIDLNMNR